MSYDDIQREVSVDRAWEHLLHITEQIPSRLAGSPNSRRMAEYAHEVFQQNGMESRLHEFLGLVSFPEKGTLRVLEPEEREIEANTLGHSASTPGLEGEVVYVGSGAESEYEGKDVRGKITLSELSYSPARHEKALIAWRKGSIAQIMMNWGDETNPAVPFGSMKSAWGNPTPEALRDEIPDIPCIGITRPEGLRLKELVERGTLKVWLSAKAENGWHELTMTTAEFGAEPGRQFLLFGGHMDSWPGPQATDNAAGSSCIMELTRVFSQHRDQLRRGLMAGLWMAHETGTMVGSTRLADVYWDRLRASCIAYLQIDQPGMAGATVWHLHSTDDVQNYAVRATEEVMGDMPKHWSRMRKTGDTSFFGIGLPNLVGTMSFTDEEIERTALANLGWWHHSLHNTIDKMDKDNLALQLKLYSRWIWDLLTMPVLPFEYLPLASRFAGRIEELSRSPVPDIDLGGPLEQARAFQTAVERFDRLAAATRERLNTSDAGVDTPESELINETMIRLSRSLVPIASTVVGAYGQDRYGHAWQSATIPSLMPYQLLGNLDPESQDYQTMWVSAVRARNRVADTLTEATRTVEAALEELA
jgi:hypothetical protein